MATDSELYRSESARGFLTGLIVGAAGGLLTDLSPVVGLGLLAVGIVTALITIRRVLAVRPRSLSTSAGFLIRFAGFLVGYGALFLFYSWNTISACAKTDDFCGNANVTPLLAAAIALLVAGFVIAVGAVVSARGTRPR